jgi:hypothetical protein
MKKTLASLMLTILAISSCSSSKDVKPVLDMTVTGPTPSAAELLFSFKKSNVSPADDDLFDKAKEHVRLLVETAKINVKWIEDEKLAQDVAFKIETAIEKETPTFVIKYAEDIFQDHSATLNLTYFLDSLFDPEATKKVSIFEMYEKASANDPEALVAVAKIRRAVLTPLDKPTYYTMNTSQYNGFIAGEARLWERKLNEYVKLEKMTKTEKRKPAQVKDTP